MSKIIIKATICGLCGKKVKKPNKWILPIYRGEPAKTDRDAMRNEGHIKVCKECYKKFNLE